VKELWPNATPIEAGVHQGCVLAPDSFATGMDWLLHRTV